MTLFKHQEDAVQRMHNGCILCGGVGSGKSRTALAYYIKDCGGTFDESRLQMTEPRDLYIITTARKRDTMDWESESSPFLLSSDSSASWYGVSMHVDSWNNIHKYIDIDGAFFIFDEQRVVGNGTWVKSFLSITKKNKWILLSATPGDTWMDYVPVFIANGYFRNRTDFSRKHVIYSRFTKYPKVDRYINSGKLLKYRREVLVQMDYKKSTDSCHINMTCSYDKPSFLRVFSDRWDIWNDKPLQDAGAVCYALRRVVNADPSRIEALDGIYKTHPRLIVFYNFNYELDILRSWAIGKGIPCSEWNGQKHEHIPDTDSWIYLVQYTAGAEGWNCTVTDTIVFFSQNYSYKVMVQAAGRTDRMNTPYAKLYYYHLVSPSPIDIAIRRALDHKRVFNEAKFLGQA